MRKKAKATARKRPGRVQRRKDLLGTVYTVISENGIDGASMRQIADRANVSTGTINYHFGNKHKLIMAALQAAYLTPDDSDYALASPLDKLKAFAFGHIFQSSTDRFWRFWVNCAAAGTRNPELRKHQNRRFGKAAGDMDPADQGRRQSWTASVISGRRRHGRTTDDLHPWTGDAADPAAGR